MICGRRGEPDDRPDGDRQDDPEQPLAELAEVVDEAHHRLAAGRFRSGRGGGRRRRWPMGDGQRRVGRRRRRRQASSGVGSSAMTIVPSGPADAG